jgi:CheY-like chemotaxis protein
MNTDFQSGKNFENLKILIVDDDLASKLVLKRPLEKLGHIVLVAKTGMEAIEICKNEPDIDLILMDIRMPEMDGYETTEKIRAFNNDVMIVVQSSNFFSGVKEKAIESGCNGYISKPINFVELTNIIRSLFS